MDVETHTMDEKQKLWSLCQGFVKDQTISCPETIYQCDWVSEHSLELIQKMCDIVGYHRYPDDEEEEA